MLLSERMKLVFDSTAIELHLIDYCFRIADNTIRIFTIKTVESLSPGQLPELVTIEDDIFFSVNKGYFHDAEIDILKLPQECIEYKQRYNARITRKSCNYTHYVVYTRYMSILTRNEKVFHNLSIKK